MKFFHILIKAVPIIFCFNCSLDQFVYHDEKILERNNLGTISFKFENDTYIPIGYIELSRVCFSQRKYFLEFGSNVCETLYSDSDGDFGSDMKYFIYLFLNNKTDRNKLVKIEIPNSDRIHF